MKLFFLCAALSMYMPYAGAADASKAGAPFPVIDATTQRARDETRKQILEDELATEKASRDSVKADLAKAENAKKPQAEIQAMRDSLQRHESNLASLGQELARVGQQDTPRSTKGIPPVALKASVEIQTEADAPAPFWDVYRRQASNRSQGERKEKIPVNTN